MLGMVGDLREKLEDNCASVDHEERAECVDLACILLDIIKENIIYNSIKFIVITQLNYSALNFTYLIYLNFLDFS